MTNFISKDFYLVMIIGFLVGWLILLPLKNVGLIKELTISIVSLSVLGFTIFAPIALGTLKFLSRYFKVLDQFGKFSATGTLNVFLDIGVLNLLILLTNISSGGPYFSLFKAISFILGTTNSYFWNKFWTFESLTPLTLREYLRFGAFTLVGTVINVGVASFVFNKIEAPINFDVKLWANIAALVAVAFSFLWNFLSYKNIVFKKPRAI